MRVGANNSDSTFDGFISRFGTGDGSLTKTGTGTLTLTGNNTYGEGTTIDAGTLLANNTSGSATGTGNVEVNNGGTLGGIGSVAGTVNVNAGGTLAPGNSPGTLTVEDIVFNTGSIFNVEIGGLVADSEYDVLAVGDNADLTGTLDIDLFDMGGGLFSPGLGNTFQILTTNANSLAGTFDTVLGADLGGGLMFDVLYGTDSVTLEVISAGVPGDYNTDGTVDAADYTTWRDTLGQTGTGLAADGDNSGTIDAADYTIWKTNFGMTASAGSGALEASSSTAAVPEPSAALLLLGTIGLGFVVRTKMT